MSKKIAALGFCFLAMAGLSACYLASSPLRYETAQRLASSQHMQERYIEVNGHSLTAFERVLKRGAPARVYIDGDGPLSLMGDQVAFEQAISLNPTPVNPVALHLASYDNAPNRVYLGRPCHYQAGNMPNQKRDCPNRLWLDERYGPEVIETMNAALDELKTRYGFASYELVGYGGGGVIALALVLHRDDITSVRTVSAPLDHTLMTEKHGIPPFKGSVNPRDFAARVAHVPQMHFFGHMEEDLPHKEMFNSYAYAAGSTKCTQFVSIKRAKESKGYVNNWPVFLHYPVDCKNP